jgi:predicted secreted hydrolase
MRNKWLALLLLTATCATGQDYKIAQPGYTFAFPRDYFNHEDYQTEWWYYTGNVKSADDHRFGFELTFFRQGVSRAESSDPWFVHDLWMAHMALSDITGQRFYSEERLNRAGPGVAGVDARTGLVWNGNWQTQIADRDEAAPGSAVQQNSPGNVNLSGIADKFALALNLKPVKQPVIQGQNGVSQKAEGAGHASHYFSVTRLLTTGSIDLDGKTYQVEGTSWIDHEFFTGSMAANEAGWDWLSIQLQDGTELMLYRLRHKDGSIDPYSSGSYVDASGKSQFLSAADFAMTPAADAADSWTSPATKATYPLRWHVAIPRLKLDLDVTTPLKSQELKGKFGTSYWEGAIDVAGSHDQSSLRGVGYLEMVGYAETGGPVIPR